MDERGADRIIDQTANQTQQNCYLRKTLQFIVPISIISFLVSCFSVFPLIFHKLQFHSSIDPFLAQALDRKCMFLLCNGILAFLASNLSTYGGLIKSFTDDQVDQLLTFQENEAYSRVAVVAVSEEEVQHQQYDAVAEEMVSEDEEESGGVEDCTGVNEMRVSTEELNKKFEEFIRRMKEEIRIEARQQYMILV